MADTFGSFEKLRAFLLYISFLSAHGLITIQPSVVYVTSGTATTQTIECNVQGLTVQTVSYMYIQRMSFKLAEISNSGASEPHWSTSRPSDVAGKNPFLEGNVTLGQGSYLRIRYPQQNVDCRDGVTYHCKINCTLPNGQSVTVNSNDSLTVHVPPGNLQIMAGRVESGTVLSIPNGTIVRSGETVQLQCSGNIGSSNTVFMRWYKRTNQMQSYQLLQTDKEVAIDHGDVIKVDNCLFARTSTLKYDILSNDRDFAIHCEVHFEQPGSSYRGVSAEFLFKFDGSDGPVSAGTRIVGLSAAFVVAILMSLLV